MKIAIHQPNFCPWLGYFDKAAKSDIFVILDNVQYEKNCYTNRTMIKTPKGKEWITMSIKKKFPQLVKDVEFANFVQDRDKILKTIECNYKKVKGFKIVFPILQRIFGGEWKYLSGFNISLIRDFVNISEKKPQIEVASDYDFKGKSTELLIEICKKFKADTYLSGSGGEDYQEEEKFKEAGIKLEYNKFEHPTYEQLWGEFIPGLSVIDYLFNTTI